jgi:PAS domain S-box-containing protein
MKLREQILRLQFPNLRNLALLAISISLTEFLIMMLLEFIDAPNFVKTIIDAILIMSATIFYVYIFVLKPTLQNSERQSSSILSSLSEGLVLQDQNGKITFFNEAALEILDLTENEILGRSSNDPRWNSIYEDGRPFPGEDHPAMATLKSGKPQSNVLMGLDYPMGDQRWIIINTVPIFRGSDSTQPVSVVSTFRNVTSERRQQKQLTKIKERLEVATQSMGFGVWDWNIPSGHLSWDPLMYQIFEIDKNDFSGDYDAFEKTLLEEDRQRVWNELLSCFSERRNDFVTNFRVRTKSNKIKIISASARCIYDIRGEIERLVGFNWDITEQTLLSEKVQKQQAQLISQLKMASLGEMAAGLAHEINNPLTTIRGKAEQLLRNIETGSVDVDRIKTTLLKIVGTSDRIAKISSALLVFSRSAEQDPLSKVPVESIVKETLLFCEGRFQEHRVTLDVQIDESLSVFCRPIQISQVLLNLLNNAFDAVFKLDNPWVRLEVVSDSDFEVKLSVTDSGNGIPKEIADKIMQPFFTTKPVGIGTGLGLSISRGIIEDHGGRLALDREASNTRFVIHLKRAV